MKDREEATETGYKPVTGRGYAVQVADWCQRELDDVKKHAQAPPMGRAYVQNVDLIIKALREYAARPPAKLKGGWVNVYPKPANHGDGTGLGLNGCFVRLYDTREEANRNSCAGRFACIQLPDVEEDQGL